MKLSATLFSLFCMLTLSVSLMALPTGDKHRHNQQVDPSMLEQWNVDSVDDFLSLTPKSYREITGERLSIKEMIQLKAAQKGVAEMTGARPAGRGVSQIVYIILGVILLGWLGIGLNDNFTGNIWIKALIITLGGALAIGIASAFCPFIFAWMAIIPGLIYTMIKMNRYY